LTNTLGLENVVMASLIFACHASSLISPPSPHSQSVTLQGQGEELLCEDTLKSNQVLKRSLKMNFEAEI